MVTFWYRYLGEGIKVEVFSWYFVLWLYEGYPRYPSILFLQLSLPFDCLPI